MRLLTHNMLVCNVKGCMNTTKNYPLTISVDKLTKSESEFNSDFIQSLIPKLDWPALVSAAQQISLNIPSELPDLSLRDDTFLQNLHTVLLDVEVEEGSLICPNCSRKFPIRQGIPDMLLKQDEV
eukprot:TRINITY_DN4313_c0_g1_i2.p1 TRINITY_DN4313_c0_g1~~TRINITY_DN4313_c0_g1_i2.p1  ORF type:complete len:146 (-),score=24.50 TRINITY_DN4313_c0_g1_i2:68-442(-)